MWCLYQWPSGRQQRWVRRDWHQRWWTSSAKRAKQKQTETLYRFHTYNDLLIINITQCKHFYKSNLWPWCGIRGGFIFHSGVQVWIVLPGGYSMNSLSRHPYIRFTSWVWQQQILRGVFDNQTLILTKRICLCAAPQLFFVALMHFCLSSPLSSVVSNWEASSFFTGLTQ